MKPEITAALVRERYSYDPETGHLNYKISRGRVSANGRVGSLKKSGYRKVSINQQWIQSARIAWLHYYGEWPENQVDHINQIRDDDRIANLRDVTGLENMHNQGDRRKNNSSGAVGVHRNERDQMWHATISVKRKVVFLGAYKQFEDAIEARERGKRQHHSPKPQRTTT